MSYFMTTKGPEREDTSDGTDPESVRLQKSNNDRTEKGGKPDALTRTREVDLPTEGRRDDLPTIDEYTTERKYWKKSYKPSWWNPG